MNKYVLGVLALACYSNLVQAIEPEKIGNIITSVADFGSKAADKMSEGKTKENTLNTLDVLKKGGVTTTSIGELLGKFDALKTQATNFADQVGCVKNTGSTKCQALGCKSEQACLAKVMISLADLLTLLIEDLFGKFEVVKNAQGNPVSGKFVSYGPLMNLTEFIKSGINLVSTKQTAPQRIEAIGKMQNSFGSIANSIGSNVDFLKLLALMLDLEAAVSMPVTEKAKVQPLEIPADAIESLDV